MLQLLDHNPQEQMDEDNVGKGSKAPERVLLQYPHSRGRCCIQQPAFPAQSLLVYGHAELFMHSSRAVEIELLTQELIGTD